MSSSTISTELSRAEAAWTRVALGYLPYLALGFFLAFALPATHTPSTLQPLVNWVAGVVPSIDRLARLSWSPEFTRTFGALMWLFLPVFTILALVRSPRIPLRPLPWSTLLFYFPAGFLVFLSFGVLIPFFFIENFYWPLGYRGRGIVGLKFILTSRIGHGTLGALVLSVSSFSLVVLWRLVRDFPRAVAYKIRSRPTARPPDDWRLSRD